MRTITGLVLALAPLCVAAEDVLPLTTECETALALSAGPATVRDGAGVLILGDEGYEEVRPSSNGFVCLVERNHPQSVIPQCFDEPGSRANLQPILEGGRLLRAGHSFEEIADIRREMLADDDIATASRPGLVYMISDFNYIHVAGREQLLKVGPHVMFHAPNLTGSDIGSTAADAIGNPGMPFITAEGPHGFMTSFVQRPSNSDDVLAHCDGQLPTRDGLVPFPPTPAQAANRPDGS